MTESRSFFENLMHRRVPHLVGVYVGATWLIIELGDWMTERFKLPPNLTSYVFVAMLVMLPAVIVFAWNHGSPGKDRWTAFERYFIPFNAIVAAGALWFLSPSLVVEAATETVQLVDETGTVQEFEVPRQGFHREVLSFFWENESGDPAHDWLAYGLPLMLSHDLNRVSPLVTTVTPFDSWRIQSELRKRGHADFLGVPQGLMVETARDRRSAALVVGRFLDGGDSKSLNVSLIDADSGDILGEHAFSGADWFTAIDDVSAAIQQYLGVSPGDNQSDDPVSQHLSDSIEAIEHYTNGQVAVGVANDYPGAITEFEAAIALDPGFAEAAGRLSRTYWFNGDGDSARVLLTDALRNSYRLSESSSFELKANRYFYDGDWERGRRVLDLWTQVQPNSTEALELLADIGRRTGTPESLAAASEAYDRLLELNPNDLNVYRRKAEIESQRGNYEAAIGYLTNVIDQEPDNAAVLIQLADIYQAQGNLDDAQSTLEDAALLSDDPLQSELGLARLEARRGLYEAAERRLDRLAAASDGPQQQIEILSAQIEIATVRGQIRRALTLHEQLAEVSRQFMPPVLHLIVIQSQRPAILAMIGRTEEAVAELDQIVAQLQSPMDSYMNSSYTGIYDAAGDRESFREWAAKSAAVRDTLPEPIRPMLSMQAARIAIWDGDFEAAVASTDQASAAFGQSMIRQFRDNLTMSWMGVGLGELYVDANEPGKARIELERVLTEFPSNAYAKLVLGRVALQEGDQEEGLRLINEAVEVWADADPDYQHLREALEILEST